MVCVSFLCLLPIRFNELVVSVSAVGSLKEDLPPGKFVIVDQFIDRTFTRNKTFFDDEIVAHVSMAHPTSSGLMDACEESIKKENIDKDDFFDDGSEKI